MLRDKLAHVPETVAELRLAEKGRRVEARVLRKAGKCTAAVYLYGYAAEILLKQATFQVDGARPGDRVKALLDLARRFGVQHFPLVKPEGYHSLLFWTEALANHRSAHGIPLPATIERELRAQTRTMYRTWWIDMRYRGGRATSLDVFRMERGVSWLHRNFLDLVR